MNLPESLSHAYIISGGSELSRAAFAERLTAAFLCEGETVPCGSCRHCRKLAAGVHPDRIRTTIPENKREIIVEQARAIRTDAYVMPNEGKRKVYLIDPADTMNLSAQNALLKVLEEGPEYAAFLLLAEEPGRLLETVRSRCELLMLTPEEESADPQQMARAEELTQLLLTGSELEVAEGLVALEQEVKKSGELLALFLLVERCASGRLAEVPQRASILLKSIRAFRNYSYLSPGVGHTLGLLMTQLFH